MSIDELVGEGKLKSNYTTTQGNTSALYYLSLTPVGLIYAQGLAREVTASPDETAAENIRRAIEATAKRPVMLVFEDGSVSRVSGSNNEAQLALFKAAVKQAAL